MTPDDVVTDKILTPPGGLTLEAAIRQSSMPACDKEVFLNRFFNRATGTLKLDQLQRVYKPGDHRTLFVHPGEDFNVITKVYVLIFVPELDEEDHLDTTFKWKLSKPKPAKVES